MFEPSEKANEILQLSSSAPFQLENLPRELIHRIIHFVPPIALPNLARCSRLLHQLSITRLHRTLRLHFPAGTLSPGWPLKFVQDFLDNEHNYLSWARKVSVVSGYQREVGIEIEVQIRLFLRLCPGPITSFKWHCTSIPYPQGLLEDLCRFNSQSLTSINLTLKNTNTDFGSGLLKNCDWPSLQKLKLQQINTVSGLHQASQMINGAPGISHLAINLAPGFAYPSLVTSNSNNHTYGLSRDFDVEIVENLDVNMIQPLGPLKLETLHLSCVPLSKDMASKFLSESILKELTLQACADAYSFLPLVQTENMEHCTLFLPNEEKQVYHEFVTSLKPGLKSFSYLIWGSDSESFDGEMQFNYNLLRPFSETLTALSLYVMDESGDLWTMSEWLSPPGVSDGSNLSSFEFYSGLYSLTEMTIPLSIMNPTETITQQSQIRFHQDQIEIISGIRNLKILVIVPSSDVSRKLWPVRDNMGQSVALGVYNSDFVATTAATYEKLYKYSTLGPPKLRWILLGVQGEFQWCYRVEWVSAENGSPRGSIGCPWIPKVTDLGKAKRALAEQGLYIRSRDVAPFYPSIWNDEHIESFLI